MIQGIVDRGFCAQEMYLCMHVCMSVYTGTLLKAEKLLGESYPVLYLTNIKEPKPFHTP